MWEDTQCPVCKTEMIRRNLFSCYEVRNYYITSCPANLAEGKYSHYELHYKLAGEQPYYESGIVYPFLIESYPGANSNVYKWNEVKGVFSRKVILDVPYIQIPWGDLEAAKNKLRLYLLMS
jgi:hypothetical protein